MTPREITTRRIHAALEREPRVNIHRHPIRVHSQDGAVILEGEVADVAAKKLALEAAAAAEGVSGVVDRLRVAPGEARGDGAVRDSLARLLLEQGEFRNCTVRVHTNERSIELRKKEDGVGEIDISVTDGVETPESAYVDTASGSIFVSMVAGQPNERDGNGRIVDIDDARLRLRERVTYAIRSFQPEIVMSHDPTGVLRQILTALILWGLLVIANQDVGRLSPKQLWRQLQADLHQAIFEFGYRSGLAQAVPT